MRHQDRVGDLVELCAERVGRGLAVDERVARHRAVGLLLMLEQEQRRVTRRLAIARCHQTGPCLVQVAREDLAVRAEVGVVGVAGRHRLTPRRRQTGHDRAGEGLVFGGLHDVDAEVVGVAQLAHAGAADTGQRARRRVELVVVALPPLLVVLADVLEVAAQRCLGGGHCGGLRGAEAEGERDRITVAAAIVMAAALHLGDLHDVAGVGRFVDSGQRVAGVELGQAIAGCAGESAGDLGERAVERGEHRLGVVTVGRVGRRVGVVGHRDRVPGRGVGDCRVGAAVARAATTVAVDGRVEADVELERTRVVARLLRRHESRAHQQRGATGVGDVVGDDRVLAAARRAGDATRHAAAVERRRRRHHVAGLQIGEGGAIGDDVLQGLHVGVVDRRVVHVAQHPAGDREPDLRRGRA